MNSTLKITGLHCASCKALIEDVARDVAGVTACDVDVAAGRARVEHDVPEAVDALIDEIAALGEYDAKIV